MSNEVIELSIDETNALRAKLGLAPLRLTSEQQQKGTHTSQQSSSTNGGDYGKDDEEDGKKPNSPENGGGGGVKSSSSSDEVLEMSVDETNALRAKLGLKPLNVESSKKVIHKPAENDREAQEVSERIEHAKLKRELQRGTEASFGSKSLGDDQKTSAKDWAAQMLQRKRQSSNDKRSSSDDGTETKPKRMQTGVVRSNSSKASTTDTERYEEKDLEGIQVSHNLAELGAGSTTVLTLADAPMLQTEEGSSRVVGLNQNDVALENVNLAEKKKQQSGLRKKRLLELGMGRAGGYAGFDDEEFEELGGTLGPSNQQRGNPLLGSAYGDDSNGASRGGGFRIGADIQQDDRLTDFDKIQQGKAVSLLPTKADAAASDYMTVEEQEQEELARRKHKKDTSFKKKHKKRKKEKKRSRRTHVDSEEEPEDSSKTVAPSTTATTTSTLLQQLEQNATQDTSSGRRKRSRSESGDEEQVGADAATSMETTESKRSRYDQVMAKGNERTRLAFQQTKPKVEEGVHDEEPDDSFLNAALSKARRLNRLRQLNNWKPAGADAVAEAVSKNSNVAKPDDQVSSGTISFAIDDTREFTRAIRARDQQKEKLSHRNQSATTVQASQKKPPPIKEEDASQSATVEVEDVVDGDGKIKTDGVDDGEDMDIEELAKQVKTDDIPPAGFEGSTSNSVGVGRGLSSFVSMLKHTGEISGKHGGKEELRGRAKDERNYENYEPMDLSKVVKIGRNATDKDRELAQREIKLEYRDKHGRLLTQKEAFRELCYQFHGHGASKKKEEKRLRQIAREQAEARNASRQVSAARDGTAAGTLGALKATQKATGKAFIVHKT